MAEPLTGEIIPAGAPLGRPSSFTWEIADEICERLSLGESLKAICRDDHMPHHVTVFRWLDRDDETGETFRNRYARARERQADFYFDEINEIADDGTNDWIEKRDDEDRVIGYVLNGEHVQRSKLRIDARKWIASKLRPKKYGDATLLKHSDADGEKLPTEIVDASAKIASLLALAKRRKDGEQDEAE